VAHIALDHASVTFKVRRGGRLPLKDLVVGMFAKQVRSPLIEVRALRDISLQLNDGDRIGIIGHNGSGKSCLLRVLAGLYPPITGTRTSSGSISSLLDITLGFLPDATGWENIRYRCYLQGETPKTVKSKLDEIAEFSELGDALDLPLKCYSPGMAVRLGFSVATAVCPEIFLIDEILAAGDMHFQSKAKARMMRLIDNASILAIISHDLKTLAGLVDRVVWMDHGNIRQMGPASEVVEEYEDHMRTTTTTLAAAA
jgi:ABC-type polysaccharide/polyol phosphate transport system ATPase subunit